MTQNLPNFKLSSPQIKKSCAHAIQNCIQAIEKIENLEPKQLNFKNTIFAFEQAYADLIEATSPLSFLYSVSPQKNIRETSQACSIQLDEFSVDLFTRTKLYDALQSFALSPLRKKLNALDERLTQKIMRSFKQSGMDLAPAQRKRLVSLEKKLSGLQSQFSQNLNENEDFLLCSEKQLHGLDQDFIQSLEKMPSGKRKVTLAYPHYLPVMENATSATTRKALQKKFFKRGGKANLQLFKKALHIRQEIASMLGYKNVASFIQEERMAENPKNVSGFLNDLKKRLRPKLDLELKELLQLKRRDDSTAKELHEWDWRYYLTQMKKENYSINTHEIQEYFPLHVVLKGMFDIYQKLFGLHFKETSSKNCWHKDVQLFEVRNRKQKNTCAYFYMDLFPRKGKYGHAAAFNLRQGRKSPLSKDYIKPISSIVANFTPPSKKGPSLLTHKEVTTLFHEFGHIMHQVLTESSYRQFAGTNVPRDFVEAPSQMLENWVWEKETLQSLSGHYQNEKKKLPDALLQKMIAAKKVGNGLHYSRQLTFALVDQKYYTSKEVDLLPMWKKIQESTFKIKMPSYSLKPASFAHIMGGYEASYYGYLWAEVFAADMFTRFKKDGLLNTRAGKDYRKWILAKGGTEKPDALLKGFLGRKPNSKAFMNQL